MVKHVILWQLKDEFSEDEKKKNTKTLEKSRVFKLFIGLSNTLISIY